MQRKFLGTLKNTYAFFTLYASIDGYDPCGQKADKGDFSLMDKWVLSKLNELVQFVDEGLAQYKITETARAIQDFVDELSNWYVRRCRERFWGKGLAGDKLAAFETLYTVLTTLCGLLAPYIPFMAEDMYQNLVAGCVPGAPESVHLTDFPKADDTLIDRKLTEDMEKVIEIVQLGRACRNLAGIKTRQPAAALYVKGAALPEALTALIADELNVKAVHYVEDARAFTTYKLKPQMRTLGPRYGKLLGKIGQHLLTMDGNDVVDAFEKGETVAFDIEGTNVVLAQADVLTEPMQKPGYLAQTDGGLTVVLDTNLTAALIEEGFVRELISKIQTMRKESDFEVTDRIKVTYQASPALAAIVEASKDVIAKAVLAVEITEAAPVGVVKEWPVNTEKAVIGLTKA